MPVALTGKAERCNSGSPDCIMLCSFDGTRKEAYGQHSELCTRARNWNWGFFLLDPPKGLGKCINRKLSRCIFEAGLILQSL